jgi:predicted metal-binding membrane protein
MTVAARRSIPTMPLAALVLGTLAAWVAFVRLGMASAGLVAFLGGWVVMMTAMMLPSAAPLVLMYRQRGRGRLILGYLLVWALVGLPVYALARAVDLMMVPAAAVAAVLVVAGAYQFTHLKNVCLRSCRSPLDFIAMRWGRGPFRLGVEHGGYCVGCCWALMAVLVAVGTMQLWWMIGLAVLIFLEKNARWGWQVARAAAVLLACTGIALLVAPAAIRYLT